MSDDEFDRWMAQERHGKLQRSLDRIADNTKRAARGTPIPTPAPTAQVQNHMALFHQWLADPDGVAKVNQMLAEWAQQGWHLVSTQLREFPDNETGDIVLEYYFFFTRG